MPSTITNQVSGFESSLAVKAPCRVGTTANIALTALQTIDDVAVAEGDRVLVTQQTDATQNGVYIASAGPWKRAADFDGTDDMVQGTQVRVVQGTSAFGLYYLDTASPVPETTTLDFVLDQATASASAAYAAAAASAADRAEAAAAAAGGNTPINDQITAASSKTAIVDADLFALADSEATWATKQTPWSAIKAVLKAYFDAIYEPLITYATAAVYRSNSADNVIKTNAAWSAQAGVALTAGTTVSWDMSLGINFTLAPAQNFTLSNPINTTVGKKGRIRIVQDATGSRTMALGSNFKKPGGTALTLSTAASSIDVLYYECVSATEIHVSLNKKMS